MFQIANMEGIAAGYVVTPAFACEDADCVPLT